VIQEHLTEHYPLEIVARATTVQDRCQALLANHFISDAPRVFAQTIHNICEYLAKAVPVIYAQIDWTAPEDDIEGDLRQLRNTDRIIQFLAQQLRYAEGAKIEKLPWSIVPSFDDLVSRFLPDVQIMLRAMWRYNYSFQLTNQRTFYLSLLSEYPDYLPGVDLEKDVLKEMKRPFHIVSFPSLEQKHILLHSLLGHEVGHLLVDAYLTEEREQTFIGRVMQEVVEYTDSSIAQMGPVEEEFKTVIRAQVLGRNVRLAKAYWRRALEEVLSDLVGALLFGPAALFSTLEMAMQGGYDVPPKEENEFYPPWRLRLRKVLRVLDEQGGWFPIPQNLFYDATSRAATVSTRVRLIRELVETKTDEIKIQADTLAGIAYREVDNEIINGVAYLLDDCNLKDQRPTASRLYALLPRLIERLDCLLPPDAYQETLQDHRIASFDEILNAVWFHRAAVQPFDKEGRTIKVDALRLRNTTNNLALKAIEFSWLARNYGESAGEGPPPEASDIIETPGVLTHRELEWWMERPLKERLVVTPLMSREETIGPSSVDVRLGNQFLVFRRESFPLLDVASPSPQASEMGRYQERIVRPMKRGFVLHPRQLVIGSTLEYIQVPKGLMCYVIGKSGWGRMGLVIATATKVDPGFRGCIALEIINEGEVPVVLYPGLPIAQLVFHTVVGHATYDGSYQCPIGPEFPKLTPPRASWKFWLPSKDHN
jgi:dCTP deaminase